MPDTARRTEEVFAAAVALAAAEQRAAYLERACGGDPDLRARVEALLRAHDRAGHLLDRPAAGDLSRTGSFVPAGEQPGVVIAGRYALVEPIGEGGMGAVWVAKQTEPVQRKVALKLIKAGMDSRAVLQRFEQERQALALMDHPNIAKVFDGGMTDERRPYFAMELVNGLPLTRFCDDAKLGIRQRLEVFAAVCQAVQHAHQKGIVHRDLKPSNILVTVVDGRPCPKVIDFGVAKALGGKLTDESVSTQFGAVVGTLEYMSPEQAAFSGIDVDTRADIYSLGVILYELLTGLRPIPAGRLKAAALLEMIRIIREEEPSRPSTRLSTDQSLAALAALRQTEPRKLMALLRGDLDWVVMKCLEKQRDRRYETANGLARDVQRYLADEVVEARPPSPGYRLRKFVRRNRGRVVAAGLMLALLVAGAIGTALGLVRAEAAREAEAAEGRRAVAAEKKASAERDVAKAVSDFLLTDLLEQASSEGQAGPGQSVDPDIKMATVLDRAAAKVKGRFDGQPLVAAAIHFTLGNAYRALGKYPPAEAQLRRSAELRRRELGGDHEDTLTALNDLAAVLSYQARYPEAETLMLEVRGATGRTLGETHALHLTVTNNLAGVYLRLNKNVEVVALLEPTLDHSRRLLGDDAEHTSTVINNLGLAYMHLGRLAEAEGLYVKSLESARRSLGADHPTTLALMSNLGWVYVSQDKTAAAQKLYLELVGITKHAYGKDHAGLAPAHNNLAATYLNQGAFAEAETWARESLRVAEASYSPDHPGCLSARNSLVVALHGQGRFADARPIAERVLAGFRNQLAPDHPDTLAAERNLRHIYQRLGLQAELEPLLAKELRAARQQKKSPDELARTLANVADNLLKLKKFVEAEPLLRELASHEEKGPGAWTTFRTQSMLGVALLGQKKYAQAGPLLLQGYAGMKAREARAPPGGAVYLRQAASGLVELYTATNMPDEVRKWRAERARYPAPVENGPIPREVR